ncbi:hypothetical protein FQA39_LY10173 [Lamprigera yunnana]|nr:hypothetical protein FQA39_LY10173 [Lamprigera yunnana]
MDRLSKSSPRGRPVSSVDAAKANDAFEHFISAGTLKSAFGSYRNICELLHLKPNVFPQFYPKLKENLTSWKAKALWKKFDARANHKCYIRGKACPNVRVLIIGAGPCGLRTAIEAQLLGAKVVVIEKRDRMSRNNVLHLWPFVIEDLRALGAKKFFGKFCAGAIDHISIRQLQCILVKVALLLGIEIHTEVSFEKLIEPNSIEKIGWRAEFKPADHPVSQYEFDVIVGADGKRNTLQGFKRKEFRGKLAIAITANFINKRTEAEARVEEISGVAFIFNQKFFKELNAETGIDLENIVYYKDDTHYFVMTAKKLSLIDKGVIKQDYTDTARLLSLENVDRDNLMEYAREAAEFSTNYQMPDLEFAVNHYGQPDVAMFDFTSMYAAENASKVIERHGYKLLMTLVGDSLLEPFWPTGSGCARGFLSSLDACWAIKAWGSGLATPLEVLAERESIYRLLAQTTPENLNKDCKAYTVDPSTRYPNLNKAVLLPQQVLNLYDTDDPNNIELTSRTAQPPAITESYRKRRRRDLHLDSNTLLSWIKEQLKDYNDLIVEDLTTSFKDGRVLCAILHHYRPDLLDYSAIKSEDIAKNNQLAFDLLEKEIGISPVLTGEEMAKFEVPDYLTMFSYLTQIYDTFRGEIPHVKHPKLGYVRSIVQCSNFQFHPSDHIQCKHQPKEKSKSEMKIPKSCKVTLKKGALFKILRRRARQSLKNLTQTLQTDDTINVFTKTYNRKLDLDVYTNLKYFDENFKEIPQKDELCCEKMITEKPQILENNKNHKKRYNNIILRHIEENLKRTSFQELHITVSTNDVHVFINPPIITKQFYQGRHKLVKNSELSRNLMCQFPDKNKFKFLYKNKMKDATLLTPEKSYDRIVDWIKMSDFHRFEDNENEIDKLIDSLTDITSITQKMAENSQEGEENMVVDKDELTKVSDPDPELNVPVDSMVQFIDKLKTINIRQFSKNNCWRKFHALSELPIKFTTISEKEEIDLSESKENVKEYVNVASNTRIHMDAVTSGLVNQFTTRSKRHAETLSSSKPTTAERKNKKRKSFEKYEMNLEERRRRLEEIAANRIERQNKRRFQRRMQTEQFIKSMQMLQMNAKADASGPFEDYSLFVYRQTAPDFQDRVKNLEKQFTYIPDRENRLPSQSKTAGGDDDFAARIKDMEDKWRHGTPAEKKPKDLTRAIGKIETSDWNIKEIEKKILENKLGKSVKKEKERVPKWDREQFLARQTKLERKRLSKQNSGEEKFCELDKGIKRLEQRLKEGSLRDLGQNKIAQITEKLKPKEAELDSKPVIKNNTKPVVILPSNSGSEYCHFCQKRVYLMERLSAEGRFFHRGCFKCQYCCTTLRLGSYLFDKEGLYGHRFYCLQHFGMIGEEEHVNNGVFEKITREHLKPLEKLKISPLPGVEGVDLLNRVQTPERIEFSNLSAGHISLDHEESLSQMDEDEWTDRNFGASTAEICSSDEYEDSSSVTGSESDNDAAYEEAMEEPPTKEGTLRWMERYKQRYSREKDKDDSDSEDYISSSDHSSYDENTSGDEDDEPVTEGEEEIRARELRKQEVCVEPPVIQTDTGSETEIVTDDSSQESSSKQNSVTEISTDSEFAVDDPTPTREIPSIVFNDFHVTKRRTPMVAPKKVQVKSGILQTPNNGRVQKKGIQLEFTPLVPSPILPKSAPSLLGRTDGYALNRTQSTGGIATKVSLELKKKYLLGDSQVPGSIQKSGSVSTLDSKFKSFHTNISDCQKLLKASPEVSTSLQTIASKGNELRSPLSPIKSVSNSDISKPSDIITSQIDSNNKLINAKQFENNLPNEEVFQHELEGRPRSPVQEIPVIVPQIDWNQGKNEKDSDMSSDSLTSSESDSEHHSGIKKSPTVKIFENIPRVEIHDYDEKKLTNSDENAAIDSLCVVQTTIPKLINNEKKDLNQPKRLPDINNVLPEVHTELHENTFINQSGRSTPSEHDSYIDHTAAILTETELSDWARDSAVSDGFEDVEYELNPDLSSTRRNKAPKPIRDLKHSVNKAYIDEFDDMGHVCHQKDKHQKMSPIENLNSILSNIEFMDTGEETSSDEKVLLEASLKNNGYVEFHNEDDIAEDSLNPRINNIVETINTSVRRTVDLNNLSSHDNNTGYCFIGNETNFGSKVVNIKPADLEKLKEKQNVCENEEDSLLVVETGTTTEENTCSDSTVKNLQNETKCEESNNHFLHDNDLDKNDDNYEEHCQRLQHKVGFCNIRDSIDIRKSKRKDKSIVSSKPDLIQEEFNQEHTSSLTPSPSKTLHDIYTKEEVKKARDENQKLVQEMVMNKMKAQNKSLERKRRSRNSFSPNANSNAFFDLAKSATVDIFPSNESKTDNLDRQSKLSLPTDPTPDVLLVTNRNSDIKAPQNTVKPLSIHSSFQIKSKNEVLKLNATNTEAFSLPDIPQALLNDKTPKREYLKLKSNECILRERKENSIDMHVQDSIEALVLNTERRNSLLYATDTLTKKRNNSFKRSKSGDDSFHRQSAILSICTPENPVRTKSVSELSKSFNNAKDFSIYKENKDKQQFKSDPNLLRQESKNEKKKSKDRDRRKSITKFISEFFGKKREGSKTSGVTTPKGFLAKISPKSKSKEKTCNEVLRRNSFCENQIRQIDNVSPPPVPPLPKHYVASGPSHYAVEDSSDGEWKHPNQHSSDTLNHSDVHDDYRINRSIRRASKQARLSRHRMAQEIQRKLEETEVKTRELEERGVSVEKALRGEDSNTTTYKSIEESELLKQWFDLMRDLAELRRYERELMVRAQELELEDRHARLQQELRERLENGYKQFI